jgi:hypothetical protein
VNQDCDKYAYSNADYADADSQKERIAFSMAKFPTLVIIHG